MLSVTLFYALATFLTVFGQPNPLIAKITQIKSKTCLHDVLDQACKAKLDGITNAAENKKCETFLLAKQCIVKQCAAVATDLVELDTSCPASGTNKDDEVMTKVAVIGTKCLNIPKCESEKDALKSDVDQAQMCTLLTAYNKCVLTDCNVDETVKRDFESAKDLCGITDPNEHPPTTPSGASQLLITSGLLQALILSIKYLY